MISYLLCFLVVDAINEPSPRALAPMLAFAVPVLIPMLRRHPGPCRRDLCCRLGHLFDYSQIRCYTCPFYLLEASSRIVGTAHASPFSTAPPTTCLSRGIQTGVHGPGLPHMSWTPLVAQSCDQCAAWLPFSTAPPTTLALEERRFNVSTFFLLDRATNHSTRQRLYSYQALRIPSQDLIVHQNTFVTPPVNPWSLSLPSKSATCSRHRGAFSHTYMFAMVSVTTSPLEAARVSQSRHQALAIRPNFGCFQGCSYHIYLLTLVSAMKLGVSSADASPLPCISVASHVQQEVTTSRRCFSTAPPTTIALDSNTHAVFRCPPAPLTLIPFPHLFDNASPFSLLDRATNHLMECCFLAKPCLSCHLLVVYVHSFNAGYLSLSSGCFCDFESSHADGAVHTFTKIAVTATTSRAINIHD
ncbi:hypothetical protein ONZ45_g17308 [Pleurotus djamor]|nr:hypothetical protein ONZ45_g17308 [Pleurotus djamor]